jgi:ABC-type sugar transport system permease subunit
VTLAALQDVPPEIEDAAAIDGANKWQFATRVLLPLVAPILLLLTFRDAVLTFENSFASVMMATQGGPYYSSYILPMFIYEKGFDLLEFGVAAVALWAMYLLSGAVVLTIFFFARSSRISVTDDTFVL